MSRFQQNNGEGPPAKVPKLSRVSTAQPINSMELKTAATNMDNSDIPSRAWRSLVFDLGLNENVAHRKGLLQKLTLRWIKQQVIERKRVLPPIPLLVVQIVTDDDDVQTINPPPSPLISRKRSTELWVTDWTGTKVSASVDETFNRSFGPGALIPGSAIALTSVTAIGFSKRKMSLLITRDNVIGVKPGGQVKTLVGSFGAHPSKTHQHHRLDNNHLLKLYRKSEEMMDGLENTQSQSIGSASTSHVDLSQIMETNHDISMFEGDDELEQHVLLLGDGLVEVSNYAFMMESDDDEASMFPNDEEEERLLAIAAADAEHQK